MGTVCPARAREFAPGASLPAPGARSLFRGTGSRQKPAGNQNMKPRYKATFRPQRWDGDYAVAISPNGPTTWDVTEYLETFAGEARERAIAGNSYDSDNLHLDPNAPQWVREWDNGPFEVDVEEMP